MLETIENVLLAVAVVTLPGGSLLLILSWAIESDRLEKASIKLLLIGGISLLVTLTLCSVAPGSIRIHPG